MTRVRSYGPSLVLLAMGLAVLTGGPYVARHLAWAEQDAKIDLVRQELRSSKPLAELSAAFREVAKVVEPSVVHIAVSRRGTDADQDLGSAPEDPEDMLRKFFRRRFRDLPDENQQEQPEAPKQKDSKKNFDKYDVPQLYGSGSGWVYTDGVHIVTNNHVVEGADDITVKFFDKTTRKATVVGVDRQTDIAVLKIAEKTEMHPAKLAETGATSVEQGDLVFAFGSPFQFEFSVSQGIVSGKGRRLGILGTMGYEDFIQTDAAINPGNSGGPLCNIYGEVIGMNTAIATKTGSYNGLGFAIPAPMIKGVVDQIIAKGKVSRGYLGVYINDLSDKMAKTFGFTGQGVLVEDFASSDSPAAKAGLKPGDIITEINGTPVHSANELRELVASFQPNQTIHLKVYRPTPGKAGGTEKMVDVKLGEMPTNAGEVGAAGRGGQQEPPVDTARLENLRKLGFEKVATLTPELAGRLNLDVKSGVLVQEVRPGSVAYAEGLRPGTVITQIMGQDVSNVSELTQVLEKQDLKQGVRLRVNAQGVNRYVLLALPQ